MKKKLGRLAALMLALVMAFSVMSVTSFADEPEDPETYSEEAPEQDPEPEPEPIPEPDPIPEPEPEPEPVPEPVPEPDPVPMPEPEPYTEPTTEEPTEPPTEPAPIIIKIDGSEYSNFAEAFDNANDKSTLKLQQDVVLTNPAVIDYSEKKEITLDLNGYEIRMYDPYENMAGDCSGVNPDDYIDKGGMIILKGGSLKITDSTQEHEGKITSSNDHSPLISVIKNDNVGSHLIIEEGTYKCKDSQEIIKLSDVYNNSLEASEVKNGDEPKVTVVVKAGVFSKNLPEEFVEEGYMLEQQGDGTWKVVEKPTEEPTSEEPTEEPTSEEPTSEEPTSEEPTSEEPTSEEPTSEEPTSEEPTSEEPTSEEPTEEPTSEAEEFEIIWQNYDGEILETDSVKSGDYPTYYGDLPVKPEDEENTYEFAGWMPEVAPASSDMTYTAVFDATPKTVVYSITWNNWDGMWLMTDSVEAGEIPVYTGTEPQKPADEQYIYTFDGWTPEVVAADSDATYTAVFEQSVRPVQKQYSVTWQNYDGTILLTNLVDEGETVSYSGDTPSRPSDNKYNYVFAGWNPEEGAIYANTVYTAIFHAVEKPVSDKFTIIWQNYDYSVLEKDVVKKDSMPIYYGSTPARPSDLYFRYEFAGWNKQVVPATANTTYTAIFAAIPLNQTYTVIWQNYDLNILYTSRVHEGYWPKYYGPTPYKPSDGQYSYVFAGWNKNITPAWSDTVYTAVFTPVPITTSYTIIWQNYDGTVLDTNKVNNGETPAYHGSVPQKPAQDNFTYEFIGWNKEVAPAYADAVYIAQFKAIPAFENSVAGIYGFTADKYESGLNVLFEKGKSEIPYVGLTQAFDVLGKLYKDILGNEDAEFKVTQENAGLTTTVTVERENGSVVIFNCADNTITFSDYTGFSEFDLAKAEDEVVLIKKVSDGKTYPTEETEVKVDLAKYGLNIYEKDNAAYIPLKLFSDLFMVPVGFNWIYNGSDTTVVRETLDDTVKNDKDKTIKDLFSSEDKKVRSEILADFEYRALCLVLDLNYGMKEDLGVKVGFDEFFRQTGLYQSLMSTDEEKYEEALGKLSTEYFANVEINEEKAKNSYEEIDNTAYVTIGTFTNTGLDLTDDEVKENLEKYIESDTIALIAYANSQITRSQSPIRRIVVDISETYGYDLEAAIYAMGWIVGTADITELDVLSGINSTSSYQSDVNLDGKITEDDQINTKAYDVFCLITKNTRDYGNLTASVLKASDAVTVIGQTTGGGAHVMNHVITGAGKTLDFAGLYEFNTVKAAAHISIASGVDADVYLKDIDVFGNRYRLEGILDSIK